MSALLDATDQRTGDFKPRKVSFDYTATKSTWIPDDPHTTHVLNVLHLILPPGERWFCDVLRVALKRVDEPLRRRELKAFIGQEATHARAHDIVADHLRDLGISTDKYQRRCEKLRHIMQPREAPTWLPAGTWLAHQQLLIMLAAIAAIEHFTSELGWWMLTNDELDSAGGDKEIIELMRWHAAEEVEHRSVAFDSYHACGGGYVRRGAAMAGLVVAFLPVWRGSTNYLMRRDQTTNGRFSLRKYVRASKQGLLPGLGTIYGSLLSFYRPRFHPSQRCRVEIATDFLTTTFPSSAAKPG